MEGGSCAALLVLITAGRGDTVIRMVPADGNRYFCWMLRTVKLRAKDSSQGAYSKSAKLEMSPAPSEITSS